MPLPPNRVLLFACCLLPALAFPLPGRPAAVVATFLPSCDASPPRPRLTTTYTAAGRPHAKPADAPVEVFEREADPARRWVALGEVRVLASGPRTSVDDLTDWAKRGARRLGGDALVDVRIDDAASATPPAGPVGLLVLQARVVRRE